MTGTLLVFALLVAPAATAARLTARPALGLALSVVIAVASSGRRGFAFFSPYPIGFWVTTFAFGMFLVATAYRSGAERCARRVRQHAGAGLPAA